MVYEFRSHASLNQYQSYNLISTFQDKQRELESGIVNCVITTATQEGNHHHRATNFELRRTCNWASKIKVGEVNWTIEI